MASIVRVGVIGFGGMGTRHARNAMSCGVQLDKYEPDQTRIRELISEFGDVWHAEPWDLIRSVDAVVIASPDDTHEELALACLDAEIPVLCEKPLATSTAGAKRIVEAELQLGRRLLQLGFMREFDPAHAAVSRVVRDGDIGRPLSLRGTHINLAQRPWRTVADVVVTSAIHDIHTARWLMGSEIVEIFARHIPADPDRPETCRLLMLQATHASGGLSHIMVNADAGYGYEVEVEVIGQTGTAGTAVNGGLSISKEGRRSEPIPDDWLQRFDDAYRIEMQEWVGGVQSGAANGPSAWDGYASLVVADACLTSIRSGKPYPVNVGEPPELYA